MTFKRRLMFVVLTALFTAMGVFSLITIIDLFHEQITTVKIVPLAALVGLLSAFFAGRLIRGRGKNESGSS